MLCAQHTTIKHTDVALQQILTAENEKFLRFNVSACYPVICSGSDSRQAAGRLLICSLRSVSSCRQTGRRTVSLQGVCLSVRSGVRPVQPDVRRSICFFCLIASVLALQTHSACIPCACVSLLGLPCRQAELCCTLCLQRDKYGLCQQQLRH